MPPRLLVRALALAADCEEATAALAAWRGAPSRRAYAAYRAAQDREDAAQDALLHQTQTSRTSVS